MKLLENVKKLIEMYRIGETRKVLDVFDQEVLTIPDTQVFRKKGVISIDFEKNSVLQSFLDKILEINPQDPEIISRKALIFEFQGDIEKATNFANKSLEIDSENSIALQTKGIIAFNNNEYHTSIKYFDIVLRKNENDSLSLLNKGLALEQMGKSEDAMNCFRKLFNFDSLNNASLDSLILHIIDWCGNDYVNSYADQTLIKKPNDKLALKIKEHVVLNENQTKQKIFEIYDKYLHRQPDQEGIDYFESLFAQGKNIEDVENILKNSEEGKNYWN